MTASLPVDFAPFEILEGRPERGLLLIADHARNRLPAAYGTLGLPQSEFSRHIAYDIGIEPLVRALAARLAAPAVLAGFSRLLIDPNRGEDDPTLIRQIYDGTVVPGNYPMSAEERKIRLAAFYHPYHDAIDRMIAQVAAASGMAPFLVSLHSFTPSLQGRPRPWHVGILWDRDFRAPRRLLERLKSDPTLIVGDNEPYDGALRGDTMFRHAVLPGYAHALIEIRQDLIAGEAGITEWAARLAPVLEEINAEPDIHIVRQYGSRTDPIRRGDHDKAW
jgi:predicted N-formylglutamate amidohydrolase